MSAETPDKLRSLRLDPNRKLRSGAGGFGSILVLIGLMLGIALALGLQFFGVLAPPPPSAAKPMAAAAPVAGKEGTAAPTPQPAAKPAPDAAPKPGTLLLSANGYVTPRQRIALIPRIIARVEWVGVEKGDRVDKGAVLVRLEDREFTAAVRRAEGQLAAAKARLAELEAGTRPEEIDRARAELRGAQDRLRWAESALVRRRIAFESGAADSRQELENTESQRDAARADVEVTSATLALLLEGPRQEQIDAARAEVLSAQAALDEARINLDETKIRAPVTGTILEKLVEVGELVTSQSFGGTRGARTEMLSIADLGNLQVELDINEADFAKIRMGQSAKVVLDAYPAKVYDGRVREIAPEANRQKATVQVKVQILNPDDLIRPEMSARVDFLAN